MKYRGYEIVAPTPRSSRMFGGEYGSQQQRREIRNPKTGETIDTPGQLRSDREAKTHIDQELDGGDA